MEFRSKQILPPSEWNLFEDLCHALFKRVWDDPFAQKHGRRGQPQHGVDVYGYVRGDLHGVQCKGKDAAYASALIEPEFLEELAKAEHFTPTLKSWTLATTSPNDQALQKAARTLTEARRAGGLFPVQVIGWGEIVALLDQHRDIAEQFYPEHAIDITRILKRLD